jgi:hypothetical protein
MFFAIQPRTMKVVFTTEAQRTRRKSQPKSEQFQCR